MIELTKEQEDELDAATCDVSWDDIEFKDTRNGEHFIIREEDFIPRMSIPRLPEYYFS